MDVGDKVRAGQVLAILEVPELNAQVMGAKADIRRSEDAIRRAESEIERAESTHQAYHAAYTRLKQASEERPGLIAEQELDDSLSKDQETDSENPALAPLCLNRKINSGWQGHSGSSLGFKKLTRTSQLPSRV